MQKILRHKTMAFLALTIWLLASMSGAHGHLCFDGQEPPISVHMDMLADHIEHHDSDQHLDADVDLGGLALSKLIKIDLPLIIAAALLMAVLLQTATVFSSFYRLLNPLRLAGIRPLLRAPPILSA